MKLSNLLICVASTFIALPLNAAVIAPLLIGDPGSTTSTTTTIGGDRTIDSALNGVGLSSGGGSGSILTETHASAQGNTNNHWLSNTINETVVLDLGGTYNISSIYLWAYNRNEWARGVRTFDIAFDTGAGFGAAVSAASLGITEFDPGDTSASSSVQTRNFSSTQIGVQAIELSNITNWGAGDRIAIAEIRFESVAIPEPSAVGLFGLSGLALLRRRRQA